ncbi:MAG: 4Fe-4S binding protein [Dehalococcoidia bacterium]
MAVELARRSVSVDLDRCNGCAICAQVCPTGVLDIIDKKSVVSRPEDCMGCELCEVECPVYAITVQRPVLRLREERPVPAPQTAPAPPPEAAPVGISPTPPPPEPAPAGISAAPPPPPPAPAVETVTGAPGGVTVRGRPVSDFFRPPLRGEGG